MSYTWKAIYKDNTCLNSKDFSSEDIDRTKISSFILFNQNGNIVLTLYLDDGQKFIYRQRTFLKSNNQKIIYHIVGWQKTIHNENIQSIIYAFEDGAIHFAGKFKENHPLFYPIVYTDKEKI